jgi:ribonucleoside-diphosphate reductase alpha chain
MEKIYGRKRMTVNRVTKRDGRSVEFQKEKIVSAILRAMKFVGKTDEKIADAIADEVANNFNGNEEISVEEIQDLVENLLIKLADPLVAKSFIVYRAQRTEVREFREKLGVDDDLKLGANAITLLSKRYLKTRDDGRKETPSEMFTRVARFIASAESRYGGNAMYWSKIFYNLMASRTFLPNTPCLANAGIKDISHLHACFFLPLEDDLSSIFQTVKDSAVVQKAGGGVGMSFSKIRPAGSYVKSTEGVASGVLTFMRVFDVTSDVIKQGGIRRGGSMGTLDVSHPEIYDFVSCKNKEGTFSNFNISVAVTHKFMKAVKADGDFELINPHNGSVAKIVKARELFRFIAQNSYLNGEPGLVFIDTINDYHMVPEMPVEGVNLCGEVPLPPYGACCLGSINLSKFVDENGQILYNSLGKVVHHAVRFLDNTMDVSDFALPQIRNVVHSIRNIGLGVMGFADLLYSVGIPYGSDESIRLAEEIMEFINTEAKTASENLAKSRGTFPKYHGSKFATPIRNSSWTSIAPTGSLSIIAETSGGCEPAFGIVFTKEGLIGDSTFVDINPIFEKVAKSEGWFSWELINKIIANEGRVTGISEVPEKWQKVFVTALEIPPMQHLLMQAAFQRHVSGSISKTINMPFNTTVDDILEIYEKAYDLEIKGLTIYRSESRDKQVLNAKQICPECGHPLIFEENCVHCSNCYYSKCSL